MSSLPTLEDSCCGAKCDAVCRELTEGQPNSDPNGGHEGKDADIGHEEGERSSSRYLKRINQALHIYLDCNLGNFVTVPARHPCRMT